MKIIVGSQSQVKIEAVRGALKKRGIQAEVVGVKAKSNVAEQPMDDETLHGARNRAEHARTLVADGDLYLAIENGIFTEGERFFDKAVVLAMAKDGTETWAFSDGVEFPKAAVEEARKRGFATTTVGQVMAEQGIVATHDDPHLSLIGKSRSAILEETVSALLSQKLEWAKSSLRSSDQWIARR